MKWLARILLAACMLIAAGSSLVSASEKWVGVDESVVERYAKEHGRETHEPLFNTDQGDLLLFVFLIAGAAGGFAAGYYWRVLMTEKAEPPAEGRQKTSR
jgi:hypothetical protein